MFKKCNHKFGEVNNKGYQYCLLCGKAELIGIPECRHNWRTINTLSSANVITNNVSYYIYIYSSVLIVENLNSLKQYKLNYEKNNFKQL